MNVKKLTKEDREAKELNRRFAKRPHDRVKFERPAKAPKRYFQVHCEEHGKVPLKQNDMPCGKAVRVSVNGLRKEKHGQLGCPLCRGAH